MYNLLEHDRHKLTTRRITYFIRYIAISIITVGLIVMISWITRINLVTSVFPNLATMKFNTAGLFLFSGLALYGLHSKYLNSRWISLFIIIVAGLTLMQYVLKIDLRIDELLLQDDLSSANDPFPGRMSSATAINFLLFAGGIIFFHRNHRISFYSGIALALTSLLALAGYLYSVQSLYNVFLFSTMALHTALCFFLLAIGLVFSTTETTFMSLFLSTNVSGITMRRFIPTIALATVVIGWIWIQGQHIWSYSPEFTAALTIVSYIVLAVIVVTWVSAQLNGMDRERSRAENEREALLLNLEQLVSERTQRLEETVQELSDSQLKYASILDTAYDAIISIDESKKIVMFNSGAENIFGYQSEEVLGQPLNILIPEVSRNQHNTLIDGFRDSKVSMRMMATDRDRVEGLRKDGTVFPAEVSLAVVELHDERLFTAVVRDITSRLQLEHEMLLNYSAVQQSEELIMVVDRNYHYISVNEVYLTYHDKNRDNIIGESLSSILGETFFEENLKERLNLCFEGEAQNFETQLSYPKLGRRNMLVTYSPIESKGQINYIVILIRDITERVATEKALAKSEQELRTTNNKLENLIEKRTTELLNAKDQLKSEIAARETIEADLNMIRYLQEQQYFKKLSEPLHSKVTSRSLGIKSLQETDINLFNNYTEQYAIILDDVLIESIYKVNKKTGKKLKTLATQMGAYGLTPGDIVEIHNAVLADRNDGITPEHAQAYIDEGRLVILQLMGYLASHYRQQIFFARFNQNRIKE